MSYCECWLCSSQMIFLWFGILAAEILSKASNWYGNIHVNQIPVDLILISIIFLIPSSIIPSKLATSTLTIYNGTLPCIITLLVLFISNPIFGVLSIFITGIGIPAAISILNSTRSLSFASRFMFATFYIIGRSIRVDNLFYPLSFLFTLSPKLCRLRVMFFTLLLYIALPSYENHSDMVYFGSLMSSKTSTYLESFPYTLLASHKSVTGVISVIEDSSHYGGIRLMKCDHSILGGTFLQHQNASIFQVFYMMDFVRYIQPVRNNTTKALIIGLGTGVTASEMIRAGVNVDIVEIDPAVYDYALKFFNLPENHKSFIMDAVKYITSADNLSYDFVIHDVFSGGNVHPSLFSLEFLKQLKTKLRTGGILALNFFGFAHSDGFNLVVASIRQVFKCIRVYADNKNIEGILNIVLYATDTCPIQFNFAPVTGKNTVYQDIIEMFAELEITSFKIDPNLVHDSKAGSLSLQFHSALAHWKAMRNLFPPIFWLYY